MSATSWFQTAGDIAAWAGWPVAIASLWYAREAAGIARQKSLRENSNLNLHLEDAKYLIDDSGCRLEIVSVTVSNSSDIPNTIVKADLECYKELEDRSIIAIRLIPVRGGDLEMDVDQYALTDLPVELSARHAKTINIAFPITFDPSHISKTESQHLLVKDTFNRTYSIEINLVGVYV